MIIKLTIRSECISLDKENVYVNTSLISDFYSYKLRIDDGYILGTNINMADGGTIFVAESADDILNMIQPKPIYLDTDRLTVEERKNLHKLFLNSMYGAVIQPTWRDFNDKMTPLS